VADRFDRFTPRAQRVLQLSQEEARLLGHSYVGAEHLLLALVREGNNAPAQALGDLGANLKQLTEAVEFILTRDGRSSTEPGLAPSAKQAIELAIDEARRRKHKSIGPEHLLLGLLRDSGGIAVDILATLGVDREALGTRIAPLLGRVPPGMRRRIQQESEADTTEAEPEEQESPPTPTERSRPGARMDDFTERARTVLQLAQEEAQRFSHNYIGTEHILLGLLREGKGVAARALESQGTSLDQCRTAVEFIIGHGDRKVTGDIGLTPRAKRVLELAIQEARRLNHHYIGTEHLLLGLIREGEGIAAGMLQSQGLTLNTLRRRVIEMLNQSSTSRRGIPPLTDTPEPPTPTERQQRVARFFDEVLAGGKCELLDKILRPTAASSVSARPGRVRDEVEALRAAFPDLQVVLDEQFGDRDRLVTRWTAHGTHLGDYSGIPATGREVVFGGVHIHHFASGGSQSVESIWHQIDRQAILDRITAPDPPEASVETAE
jgi:ATP-dependent Clp protease ATP-binding subunit ClpA/predicted ester cyclase